MRENRYTFYTGSDALSNRGSSNKSNHVIMKKISAINHVAPVSPLFNAKTSINVSAGYDRLLCLYIVTVILLC